MIEHGTVIGNVARTHRPCGACGELVETCPHAGRGDRDRRRREVLTERERDEANLARAERRRRQAADVAAFMRPYRRRP